MWLTMSLAFLGCVLAVVMLVAQRRQLSQPVPGVVGPLPAVSVLKPLKGVDADLERNLRSFLCLDYPDYELLLGVQDPRDPALEVAHRVASGSRVAVRVVVGGDDDDIGFNPKVNNLANLLPWARHDLLLISDSNVAVGPSFLSDLVAHALQPDVGLVTSFIRGVGGRGVGGVLEAVQLNTFVMGGVAAATSLFGRVAAVGKSMLMRRDDLERIGGLAELGRYLAEDQVCGEEIATLGRRVVVSPQPVDNVLGEVTVRRFASRHLRWARIRRHIAPWGYASELLTNPVPAALAMVIAQPGVVSAVVVSSTLAILSGTAWSAERRLGVRRRWWLYPGEELLRGILLAALWPVPFINNTVAWRGRRFTIRRRTLLEPVIEAGPAWSTPVDGEPDGVAA